MTFANGHLSAFSKDICSESIEPISIKFYMQSPGKGKIKLYIWSRSHDQDGCHANIRLKICFSTAIALFALKLCMKHLGL